MKKGSVIFKGIVGLSMFAIFFALFVFAPNINSTVLGIDAGQMSNETLTVFRIGLFGLALAFMFWWTTDVV